ncbi:MAG TPA: sulfate adenylyltransferase, partial [Candidatus Thermoplasmatota archaeon]|nr:sulfate adenylyltransferase [Candidatus Thermoplasmatota archaeon]
MPVHANPYPLVSRIATPTERERFLAEWSALPQLTLTPEETQVVNGIAHGVYSPLEGFMTRADYDSVLTRERLANGTPWAVPVTLHVEATASIPEGARVGLNSPSGAPLAVLEVADRFRFDPEAHSRAVFGTTEARHPGVQRARAAKPLVLGGRVT